jgi:hypothetical protein
MGCPSLFAATHLGGDRMSDEEIDQMHDQMVANEGLMFDEVVHGRAGPEPAKWSVLPSTTRHMPLHWVGEAEEEAEVLAAAWLGESD